MALGAYQVSDDASLLAYATDDTGFRQYTLFVKDLRSGELVETVAEKVGSVAWAADGQTLFYTVEEESTKRQYRLYRHRLGDDAHDLVYEEADLAFNVGVYRTRSLAYLVLGVSSLTTGEARFLPADEPLGEWRLVAPRRRGAGVRRRPPRRRLLRPGERHRPELPAGESTRGEPRTRELDGGGASPRRRHARGGGLLPGPPGAPRARGRAAPGERHRPADGRHAPDRLPGGGVHRGAGGQPRVRHPHLPLRLPVAGDAAVRLRLRHGRRGRRRSSRSSRCSAGYDRRRYETERVLATAPDGVAVPLSIVYRRGLAEGRLRPVLPVRVRLLRLPPARDLLLEPGEPPRPRRRRGPGPRPRRRGDGQGLARRRADDEEAEHLHRLRRRRRVPAGPEVREPRPARHRGRQRGRAC